MYVLGAKTNSLLSEIGSGAHLKPRHAESSENLAPKAQDGRAELLLAIREGRALKKVDPDKLPPVPRDTRSELMRAIRGGKKLRKVDPSDAVGTVQEKAQGGRTMLMNAIRQGMELTLSCVHK